MVNSKQKGGSFERSVCKALSLWLSGGTRDDLLWRSAMSGGRATVQHRGGTKNVTQGGDISAIDPLGHKLTDVLSIECKHLRSLDLGSSLLRGYGALVKCWDQTVRTAGRHGKRPVLIAKQNGFPVLVVTDLRGVALLGNDVYKVVRLNVCMRDGRRDLIVFRFDEMLKECSPP